jgi:hypothetical protein
LPRRRVVSRVAQNTFTCQSSAAAATSRYSTEKKAKRINPNIKNNYPIRAVSLFTIRNQQ